MQVRKLNGENHTEIERGGGGGFIFMFFSFLFFSVLIVFIIYIFSLCIYFLLFCPSLFVALILYFSLFSFLLPSSLSSVSLFLLAFTYFVTHTPNIEAILHIS